MRIKEVVVIRNKALNFMRFFNTFGVESLTEKPMSFNHDAIDCANCKKRFTSVFCKVENDTMEQINEEKICTPYKKGQIIFHEGSRPLGIYCVNRGKIKLVKLGEDGKEQILRLIKPGDLMGYRALLSGDKYSASAVVLEEAGICFIPKELFMGVLQKDGVLSMEIMKLLSDDLRKAEVSITHFAKKKPLWVSRVFRILNDQIHNQNIESFAFEYRTRVEY